MAVLMPYHLDQMSPGKDSLHVLGKIDMVNAVGAIRGIKHLLSRSALMMGQTQGYSPA